MVRAELAQREAAQLERTRSDLLLEASRRQTARAMQEAERCASRRKSMAEEAEQCGRRRRPKRWPSGCGKTP